MITVTFDEWLGLVVLVGVGVLYAEYIRWTWEENGK